ncbi:unnamed protein product [Acanthoscelides obtectus]|uniref:Uncharacterized protein n=1 Tax=Acanthoscelides obtectus TaxID=200917 RepID=A0A9P0LUL1_ACAOB|nr:unnamed protein product [Acanthoscelides obtectus]CAK1656609.1 hypothetical protein AOBTE_LOCUS19827 [Acanthoscelides obtectus]
MNAINQNFVLNFGRVTPPYCPSIRYYLINQQWNRDGGRRVGGGYAAALQTHPLPPATSRPCHNSNRNSHRAVMPRATRRRTPPADFYAPGGDTAVCAAMEIYIR